MVALRDPYLKAAREGDKAGMAEMLAEEKRLLLLMRQADATLTRQIDEDGFSSVFRREDVDSDSIQVSAERDVKARLNLSFVVNNCNGRLRTVAHIRGDSVLQFRDWLNDVIAQYGKEGEG
jgi:hypothetical protein